MAYGLHCFEVDTRYDSDSDNYITSDHDSDYFQFDSKSRYSKSDPVMYDYKRHQQIHNLWLFWKNNKLNKLKFLVSQNNALDFINIMNKDGLSLLYCVIDIYKKKYYGLVKLLLKQGADVNYCDTFDL